MSNRTEHEARIEKAIIDLIEFTKGENIFEIDVNPERRQNDKCAYARLYRGRVILSLYEPSSPKDLSEWGEEIALAETLIDKVRKERAYEKDKGYNHPNLFKAISFRVIG